MGRTIEADVVVVGAGIAGLSAAKTLVEAGRDVVVLEARDRVGGRVLNVEIGGQANELGGQWVAPYQDRVLAYLRELDIELFPSFREGSHVYVGADGVARRYEGHDAPLGDVAAAAYAAAEGALDAMAKELDPEAPWKHPRAGEWDSITFEAWLQNEVPDTLARDLLRAWLSGGFLTKPAYTFSLLQGLWVIAGAGGIYELFEPEQCLAYRIAGGSQLLPLRLAEGLGERVLVDAPVRGVRWSETGVEVDAGDVQAVAKQVIVAIPPNLTAAIRFEPALPGWRMRLEQALSQGVVIKVFAVYDHPFWREDGLSGQGFAPGRLVREVYDNSPPSGEPGVLVTFLAGENAEAAARLDPAVRRAAVLDGFASYVGDEAREATDYIELDWSAEEWTRGAYAATFGVGGLTRFGADLRRPIGPIHWACADIAGVGHMHMDGAIRSGESAGAAVLARL